MKQPHLARLVEVLDDLDLKLALHYAENFRLEKKLHIIAKITSTTKDEDQLMCGCLKFITVARMFAAYSIFEFVFTIPIALITMRVTELFLLPLYSMIMMIGILLRCGNE